MSLMNQMKILIKGKLWELIRVKFGINKNFIYKKIRSKEIVSVLLSKRIRLVSVKSIEEFLASSID